MNFLGQLGIDFNLVIAQTINFVVLAFILFKFVYKPIFRKIEEDEKKLNEVQAKSDELDFEKKNFEFQKEKEIVDMKQRSEDLIGEAEEIAKDIKEKAIEKAQEQADEIVKQANLSTQFFSSKKTTDDILTDIFKSPKIYLELEKVFFEKLMQNLKTDLVRFKNIKNVTLESAHNVPRSSFDEFSIFVKRYIGESVKIEVKENHDLIAGYRILTDQEAIDQNLLFEITNEE